MSVRANLRPFRWQLANVALGIVFTGFWLVVGPDYMRYFATFLLGANSMLLVLLFLGRIKPPPGS
jgi:hypothetical protein